jgi:hypothetical protein
VEVVSNAKPDVGVGKGEGLHTGNPCCLTCICMYL